MTGGADIAAKTFAKIAEDIKVDKQRLHNEKVIMIRYYDGKQWTYEERKIQ